MLTRLLVLLYSRDALSEPLRMFDELLSQIRSGSFLPDLSRSGRAAKRRKQESQSVFPGGIGTNDTQTEEDKISSEDDGSADDELESISESSSSSSESEAEDSKVAELAKRRVVFEAGFGGKKFMCKASQLLHIASDLDDKKFRCGRKLSPNFIEVSNDKASLSLGCLQCFPKS